VKLFKESLILDIKALFGGTRWPVWVTSKSSGARPTSEAKGAKVFKGTSVASLYACVPNNIFSMSAEKA
jgi:hypothetical protein